MKTLVLGLDCAAPEILLGSDDLPNINRLMQMGCYGRLKSVIPPITVPAWMCAATSQDPGSLGVYGFRNRADRSYGPMKGVDANSIRTLAIWDQFAREGKKSIIVGVPPSSPPRRVNGISVGCFLTPDTEQAPFTHPPEMSDTIRSWVGHYPVDVSGFRTDDKSWLRDQIFAMSRTQFETVRRLITNCEWDYFQFVDIGLDRVHHGFWRYHDPKHHAYVPGNPYESVIRDYYRHLDEQIGSILELLDDQTNLLVMSDHGATRLEGCFAVNEWLIREGYLTLNQYPSEPTVFDQLDVDWDRTTAWSEGGYYARVFLNVRGREPKGTIDKADIDRVRDELAEKLRDTRGPDDQPLGTLVFKPEEVYRNIRNIAPDLIAHFGALSWRSSGKVGGGKLHLFENDTGPDDCNHAQFGAFILCAPGCPRTGEVEGMTLLDVAPTLTELSGVEPLPDAQGKSIVGESDSGSAEQPSEQEVIRDRLRGLGYID